MEVLISPGTVVRLPIAKSKMQPVTPRMPPRDIRACRDACAREVPFWLGRPRIDGNRSRALPVVITG